MATTHPNQNFFGPTTAQTAIQGSRAGTINYYMHQAEIMRLDTASEIRFAMAAIPSGLPELYVRMLNHIKDKHGQCLQEIAFLLHCVILVKRPLSLQALCALVTSDGVYHTGSIQGKDRIRDLVFMSGGFLELQSAGDDSPDVFVALVHQSARDYLVTELNPGFQGFCIDESDIHLKIAQRCITCLEHNWAEAGRLKFDAAKTPVHRDQADLVDYTLEFWHYHARSCGAYAPLLFDLNRPFFGADLNVRMYWMYSGLGASPPEPVIGLDLSQANFLWKQSQLSAIHVASLLGNVLWLVSLVQQSGTHLLSNVDGFGVTPLQYASLGGHTEAVNLIIDHVDMGQYGRALWFAIIAGSASVARLLVEKGANVDIHGETNQELIDLACDGDDEDNNIIMKTGQKSISLLLKAIEDCRPEIVQILLDKHANLEPNGQSAVRYAATYGDEESYKLLIAHCANIDHTMEMEDQLFSSR